MASSTSISRRRWQPDDVVRISGSYFARCYGQGEYAGKPSDTGPYSTREQAEEFITAIRP
jgi:hypothetical protein